MKTIYRKFTDKPDMVQSIVKRGNKTEISEWESKFQRNLDLPDNLSYCDMGIEDRVNTHLDVSNMDGKGCMDDRHFREHCVVYGQSLFFVHQKLKADMQPPLQLRPEWIQEKLECEFEDACTLSEAWKQLGYNKWVINKMVFGYFDNEKKEWKNGLQYVGPSRGREFAEYFEELALEFGDVIGEANDINGIRGHYYDVAERMISSGEWYAQYHIRRPDVMDQMAWIEHMSSIEYDESIQLVYQEVDQQDGYVNYLGGEEIERKIDAFGINRLFHGAEGIDQELVNEIKEASALKLKKIQRRFYPNRTGYTGTIRKAQYWWMTPMQKSVAWEFIKARREELSNYTLSECSKRVLDIEAAPKIKRALIASYCAGNSFNLYGELMEWKKRPNENEILAIWAQFNKLT